MTAFARRVADNPSLHTKYGVQAVRFVTAMLETYAAFKPELQLDHGEQWAYFVNPPAYSTLDCGSDGSCQGYHDYANKPVSYNESLTFMKAMAEAALAANSALYRQSADATPERLALATVEFPRVIAKGFRFLYENLVPQSLSDGTPVFKWTGEYGSPSVEDAAHAGFTLAAVDVLWDTQPGLNL